LGETVLKMQQADLAQRQRESVEFVFQAQALNCLF
jgi:hypothetical protein